MVEVIPISENIATVMKQGIGNREHGKKIIIKKEEKMFNFDNLWNL
ncbi:MAG: hypothetical protein F6K22_24555 [Okeania sp. SIO2F4]|nr:hypothetical protein [Okeania sp. SIO2F4]